MNALHKFAFVSFTSVHSRNVYGVPTLLSILSSPQRVKL